MQSIKQIFVLCYVLQHVQALSRVTLISGHCRDYNQKYLRNVTVDLRKGSLTLEMDIITTLEAGIIMRLEFSLRQATGTRYQKLFEYTIDMCTMLSGNRINMFKKWFTTMLKYGNFAVICPVPPNHYFLRGYRADELLVPTFLLNGFYRVAFDLQQNKQKGRVHDFVIACLGEVLIANKN